MKANTKIGIEFPDDPMMEQLHDVRRKIAEELRGLNPQEKMKKIRHNVRTYLKKKGYSLESREDGTFKLVKTKD
jgi:hypothetical protein